MLLFTCSTRDNLCLGLLLSPKWKTWWIMSAVDPGQPLSVYVVLKTSSSATSSASSVFAVLIRKPRALKPHLRDSVSSSHLVLLLLPHSGPPLRHFPDKKCTRRSFISISELRLHRHFENVHTLRHTKERKVRNETALKCDWPLKC